MYAAEKTEHLWIVRRPTDTPGDPFCVTDYGEKGEADARMIADALNEVAQLRAENERLKSELKDIRATVGVAFAVLQSDYEPDASERDTLLVNAAMDMRAAALGKGAA